VRYIVIDTEADRFPRFGLAEDLAAALGAEHYRTEDLRADELASVVRG
jgi:magnesium chelatase subunit D